MAVTKSERKYIARSIRDSLKRILRSVRKYEAGSDAESEYLSEKYESLGMALEMIKLA